MASSISNHLIAHQTTFLDLPDEILPIIVRQLPHSDLTAVRVTHPRLYTVVTSEIYSLDFRNRPKTTVGEYSVIKKIFYNLKSIKLPYGINERQLKAIVTDQITGLDLAFCLDITQRCFDRFVSPCPLQELALPSTTICSQETLCTIIRKGELKKLSSSNMTDDILDLIGKHLKELTELRITSSPLHFTDVGMKALLEGCPKIEVLELEEGAITKDIWPMVATKCPNLKEFSCYAFDYAGLQFLLDSCLHLNKLDIAKRTVTGYTHFDSDAAWTKLLSCQRLTDLTIDDDVSLNVLESAGLMPHLKFFRCSLSGETLLQFMKKAPNLEKLTVGWLEGDAELFAIASSYTTLKVLHCNGDLISDEGIKAVANGCSELKEFSFCANDVKVTSQALYYLGEKCRHLRYVSCSVKDVTDEAITYLTERCPSLQVLQINYKTYKNLSMGI